MFTGLVSDIGKVLQVSPSNGGVRLRIGTSYDITSIADGASIACAGVCLTVVGKDGDDTGGWFDVEAVPETLEMTTLSAVIAGQAINVERPLTMGDELGGHAVLGHVDGIARITRREHDGTSVRFEFKAPDDLWRFIAKKGSVTLDGTSLTVTDVDEDIFAVAIIPHTLAVTTWGEKAVGDTVNLEIDVLARYMQRLIETSDLANKPQCDEKANV